MFANALTELKAVDVAISRKNAEVEERNPDTAAESPPGSAKVQPRVAMEPPVNPTAIAGLSPILSAMKPARTGSMNPKATLPALLKNAAAAVTEPMPWVGSTPAIVSIRKERAIMIPPPMTNGSM